jgi:hypothetical protein
MNWLLEPANTTHFFHFFVENEMRPRQGVGSEAIQPEITLRDFSLDRLFPSIEGVLTQR